MQRSNLEEITHFFQAMVQPNFLTSKGKLRSKSRKKSMIYTHDVYKTAINVWQLLADTNFSFHLKMSNNGLILKQTRSWDLR